MSQKLIFPQEIEVWYVLPTIRKRLALRLVEKGWSQTEVAKLMHLTGAAISQYKKEKRAKNEIFCGEMDKEIDQSVKTILQDRTKLYTEIVRLNQQVRDKGIICKLHKEKSLLEKKELPCPNCDYHV
ncbi:MAG: hypothetical protein WCV90_08600 [Candidatus Woesearchaeota archaeon]|jgi:hypothetical protein